ncbi:MAG: hypothetical protein HYS09_05590 [Chloroflexi bacterium]|nr:hypothetical protein [Chloroflexota bacterium]
MDSQDKMIGTGPFIWEDLKALQEITFNRNPNWFGWRDGLGGGRPYVDKYVAIFSVLDEQEEPQFREKKIDVGGFASNPQWVFNLKDEMPELELLRQGVSGWVNSRFKVECPPYNDPRVRRAVHLAADRQQVIDTIWQGEAQMQPPVGFVIKEWALPPEELQTLPGYRQGAKREDDLTEARRLYTAAGSPDLSITFADQPSYIPAFAPQFIGTLRSILGGQIEQKPATAVSYPRIAEGLLRGCEEMFFTWGFDNGWIDLDDWVYPYFHSTGSKNSFRVKDPELDDLLDAQRAEFNLEKRQQLGYRIQRYILGVDKFGNFIDKPGILARVDYASLITADLSWPYYKNRTTWPWFGNNHWLANVWLDKSDPTFQGRP